MWFNHKFFKVSAGIIMVLLIILLLGKINFFLAPFKTLVAVLFFPIIISGLLYYILRPLVNLIEKISVPRTISVIIVFCLVIVLFALISVYAGNLLVKQVNGLISSTPQFIESAKNATNSIKMNENLSFIPIDKLQQQLTAFLENIIPFIYENIMNGISAITGFATVLLVVPFILFFLLKDDRHLPPHIIKIIPDEHKQSGYDILSDMDKTISNFITGQALLSLILGTLMYIGYLIIGIKYSLILGIFAMVALIIPYLGAFIGILPALLVGLADSPFMSVKIIIVMLIVQFVGNFLAPVIMGKRMNIHPLTFIIVFLCAASLFGFIGMLVSIPAYAVLKELVKNLYEIYKLRKKPI